MEIDDRLFVFHHQASGKVKLRAPSIEGAGTLDALVALVSALSPEAAHHFSVSPNRSAKKQVLFHLQLPDPLRPDIPAILISLPAPTPLSSRLPLNRLTQHHFSTSNLPASEQANKSHLKILILISKT